MTYAVPALSYGAYCTRPHDEDTDSNSDSKHEFYCMEDVRVDLKDINASKTVALSDLCRPPQKCQKINHLTPMTIVLIKTWLEKSIDLRKLGFY